MTMIINNRVDIALLSTGNYGSVTSNTAFTWRHAKAYAGQLRLGTVTGSGRVDWEIQHACEDTDSNPNYETLLSGPALTLTSAVDTAFESQSMRPLMPFGRLVVTAKGADGDAFTVANIAAHILADLA
jgi:hypothetical protein